MVTQQPKGETTKAHKNKGSIKATIPKDIAEKLGITDGTTIYWREEDDHARLERYRR